MSVSSRIFTKLIFGFLFVIAVLTIALFLLDMNNGQQNENRERQSCLVLGSRQYHQVFKDQFVPEVECK